MFFWIGFAVFNGVVTYYVATAVINASAESVLTRVDEMLSFQDARNGARYADLLRKLSFLRRQNNLMNAHNERRRAIAIHRLEKNEDSVERLIRDSVWTAAVEDWEGP